jgi:hypothetical protein
VKAQRALRRRLRIRAYRGGVGGIAVHTAWETFVIGAVTGLALITLLNIFDVSSLVFGVP